MKRYLDTISNKTMQKVIYACLQKVLLNNDVNIGSTI